MTCADSFPKNNNFTRNLPEPFSCQLDRVKRIWYLSPMRAAKVQASLRIRAVSPEPSLLAHTSSESRRTFRQKARSLAPLNGWACAVKICHDGMLEDTNSLDAAQLQTPRVLSGRYCCNCSCKRNLTSDGPRHDNACLRGLRPGKTQTGLLSFRD